MGFETQKQQGRVKGTACTKHERTRTIRGMAGRTVRHDGSVCQSDKGTQGWRVYISADCPEGHG